jgi:HEPN domain-containing protein
MSKTNKYVTEWFKQSDYDLRTAEAMFKSRRYIYTVFMCHLSMEKALKGLYCALLKDNSPKTHDLIHLSAKIGLEPPAELKEFIAHISQMSIVTRYPGNLAEMQKAFGSKITAVILKRTKEALKWVRGRLNR